VSNEENFGTGDGAEEAISVSVRVRPMNSKEVKQNCEDTWRVIDGNSICQVRSDGSMFTFDNVFDRAASTQQVYDKVARELVSSVLKGINGTMFAYGQTASGKTYTMQGEPSSPGILHLAAQQVFEEIAQRPNHQFLLHVSYIEIFNEQVKDLLSDSNENLRIREDRDKGFFVDNLAMKSIVSVDELLKLKEEGESRRHIGETQMNLKSSRSHTIFTLKVEMRDARTLDDSMDDDDIAKADLNFGVLVGQLNLVDLAGSENARATGAEGGRLKEGGNINRSLLSLSRVISQLAAAKGKSTGFINWRDSKLTQILQPSLAGNCKTAIVCCITPASKYAEESRSTLNFASRAKQIRTRAVVNEVLDGEGEMRKLKQTIHQLRTELASQQAANQEKSELEERIKNLKKLVLGGPAALQAKTGENVEELKVPERRARTKRKQRETWCPGDFQKLKVAAKSSSLDGREAVAEMVERESKKARSSSALASTGEAALMKLDAETNTEVEEDKSKETAEKLRKLLDVSESEKAELRETIKRLREDLAEKDAKIVQASAEALNACDAQQSVENDLKNQLVIVKQDLEDIQNESSELRCTKEALENELKHIREDKEALQETLQAYEETQRRASELSLSAESELKARMTELEVEREVLQGKIQHMEDVLVQTEIDREEDRSEILHAKAQVADLVTGRRLVWKAVFDTEASENDGIPDASVILDKLNSEQSRLVQLETDVARACETAASLTLEALILSVESKDEGNNGEDSVPIVKEELSSSLPSLLQSSMVEDVDGVEQFQKVLKQKELQISLSQQEIEKLRRQIEEKKKEVLFLQRHMEDGAKEASCALQSGEQELGVEKRRARRLIEELDGMKENNRVLSQEITCLRDEHAKELERLHQQKIQIEQQLQSAIASSSSEVEESLRSSLRAQERKIEDLKERIQECQEVTSRQADKVAELETELFETQQKAPLHDENLMKKIQDQQEQIVALTRDLQEARNRLKKSKENSTMIDEERQIQETRALELQAQLDAFKEQPVPASQIEALRKELFSLQEESSNQIKELEAKNAELKDSFDEQKKKFAEIMEDFEKERLRAKELEQILNEQVKVRQEIEVEVQRLRSCTESYEKTMTELRFEIEQRNESEGNKEELERLRQRIAEQKCRIESLERVKMTKDWMDKYSAAKKGIKDLKQIRLEYVALKAKHEELEKAYTELHEKLKSFGGLHSFKHLRARVIEVAKHFGILDEGLEPTEFIQMLSDRLKAAEEELVDLKTDEKASRDGGLIERLADAERELGEMRSARETLQSKLADWKGQMKDSNEELAQLRATKAELDSSVKDLKSQLADAKEEGAKTREDLLSEIEELKSEVRFLEKESLECMVALRKLKETHNIVEGSDSEGQKVQDAGNTPARKSSFSVKKRPLTQLSANKPLSASKSSVKKKKKNNMAPVQNNLKENSLPLDDQNVECNQQ